MERVFIEWGTKIFFKEVEDFKKEREESGEGEVFKNDVRSLNEKEVFLKVYRKRRGLGVEVWRREKKKKRRGLLKNGGGEILVKRVGHFIN